MRTALAILAAFAPIAFAATPTFAAGPATATPSASPQDLPCEASAPRQVRADDYSFSSDRVRCYSERTIVGDAEFYSGDFKADAGGLRTRFLGAGKVRYEAAIVAPRCKAEITGIAALGDAPLVVTDGAVQLTFWDGGVAVHLGMGTACPGFQQEFFYDPDPGGNNLVAPNWIGSGCDLDEPGISKRAFVSFFYAFQRAVAVDDRKAVARMVSYPLAANVARGSGGKSLRITTPGQFLSSYGRVFDRCIRRWIANQRIGDLWCNHSGVTFDGGALWIAQGEGRQAAPKLVAVNFCGDMTPAVAGLVDLEVGVRQDAPCAGGEGYAITVTNHHGPDTVRGAWLTAEISPALGIRSWRCTAEAGGASCGDRAVAGEAITALQTWIDLPRHGQVTYQLCGKKTGGGMVAARVVPSQHPPNIGLVDANRARASLAVSP